MPEPVVEIEPLIADSEIDPPPASIAPTTEMFGLFSVTEIVPPDDEMLLTTSVLPGAVLLNEKPADRCRR